MNTNDERIDWTELRRRIALTPIVMPPTPSQEMVERKRERDRTRWNSYYHDNIDHCRERQNDWAASNPDKVKAKRDRCYAKLKSDPVRLERKRERQRQYKARLKLKEAA